MKQSVVKHNENLHKIEQGNYEAIKCLITNISFE